MKRLVRRRRRLRPKILPSWPAPLEKVAASYRYWRKMGWHISGLANYVWAQRTMERQYSRPDWMTCPHALADAIECEVAIEILSGATSVANVQRMNPQTWNGVQTSGYVGSLPGKYDPDDVATLVLALDKHFGGGNFKVSFIKHKGDYPGILIRAKDAFVLVDGSPKDPRIP